MKKWVFYYYMQFGSVCAAKVEIDEGVAVGGEIHALPNNIHEITEDEFNTLSLYDLKGKYEYKSK